MQASARGGNDPQHQDIPASWQGQDLTQLASTVESYTHDVIAAFAAQGTPVDMVSIGNEIRNGMLWPVGQVDWSTDTGWGNLTTLLKAGVAGARSGNPGRHPLAIMLHFDQGGNNANSVRFFDHMLAAGVPFDVIGLSYYTFFHGPLTALRDNVDDLATRYGKKIVIAESQYAWTLAGGDSTGNFVWQASQIEPGYPATPGGQLSFYNDLLSILSRAPNHLAIGLFYWEPEWDPGRGLGARRRYTERQPDAVLIHRRCVAIGRAVPEPTLGVRQIRALDAALRGTERCDLRGFWNVIGNGYLLRPRIFAEQAACPRQESNLRTRFRKPLLFH
jgi:arabinogalactan endo-1,4-beta-galactosidase